ncbi:MAG: hypothetical protein JXA00_04175, partial [Candidatus Thermoplasmatota archaeon]|nr:hypothetical protein [Candidatus Thermoplasmatota archaeon]
DGYPAFTLGVLDYLNRTNSSVSLNLFFFSMAMLCLLGIGLLFRTITRTTILWVLLLTGLLACAVAAPLFTALTTMTYPAPSPHTDYTQVCFKQEHSRFNISVKPSAIQVSLDENYGTFYVWTQRLGCVPSMVSTFDEAVEQGDIIVIINPTCSFTEQETARITTYLESGGKLLLLDSIMNTKSTANELTSTYGIWISTTAEDQPLIPMLDNQTSLQASIGNITAPYLTITGGTPLLRGANNSTFASVVHIVNDTTGRQGMLLVVVDAYTFSDAAMGGLFTEPTAQQQARYDLEFYLFSQLLT